MDVSDELRLSFAARQSDGMNEFDGDSDFDGFVEDQDKVSEFRNSTMRVQGDYVSVDGRFQHKLVIAQSNNDNEAFDAGRAWVITLHQAKINISISVRVFGMILTACVSAGGA